MSVIREGEDLILQLRYTERGCVGFRELVRTCVCALVSPVGAEARGRVCWFHPSGQHRGPGTGVLVDRTWKGVFVLCVDAFLFGFESHGWVHLLSS